MASRFDKIKGITIEIGGDTTKLSQALQDVNKELKQQQKDLKDIEKLLKMDPGNIELMRQKHEKLGEAIKDSKEKLDTLKKAQKDMNELDSFTPEQKEQYDALQREIIETEENIKNLEKSYKNSTIFNAIGTKLQTQGKKVEDFGKKFLPVTGIVTGLGTAAVKTTADFDESMSKVAAISGATGEDFDKLRDKAREMGAKTKFSASESADALTYMAMAGWKTEDMLEGLEGIMYLAAASGEDLGLTSDIVTDALTAFGMKAGESSHFADVLAAASSNANTNVSMMGESFKYVAPVAGAMGYTAEDVALALGLMANSGIKAGTAGASLRNIITNMAKPTKDMQLAMDNMGLSVADSEGNLYSLREIMVQLRSTMGNTKISNEELNSSLADLETQLESGQITEEEYEASIESLYNRTFGMDGAQKAMNASMLGGKRAMASLLAIAGASDEDFDKLCNAVDNSSEKMALLKDGSIVPLSEALASGQEVVEEYNGAAEQMASIMQDNLNGKIVILQSALQELAISFGDILMPVITKVVEVIQSAVDWLNSLDEGTKEIITTIAGVVAAIAPLLIGMGKISQLVGTIIQHPILATIGLIITALVTLYNTNEDFRNLVNDLWNNYLVPFGEFLSNIFAASWDILVRMFTEELPAAIANIKEFFSSLWNETLVPLGEFLGAAFLLTWEEIKTFFLETIPNAIGSAKEAFLTFWNETLVPLMSFIGESFMAGWESVKAFFTETIPGAIEGAKTAFTGFWNETLTPLLAYVKDTFLAGWEAVKTFFTETIPGAISGAKNAFITFWNETLTPLVGYVKDTFLSGWEAVKTFFLETVPNAVGKAKDAFAAFWDETLVPFMEFIKDTFIAGWETIKKFFTETIPGAIDTTVSSLKNFWENYLVPVKDFILGAFSEAWNAVKTFFTETIPGAIDTIVSAFKGFWENTLIPVKDFIMGAFSDAWNAVKTFFTETIPGAVSTVISSFEDFWNNYLIPIKDFIVGAFSTAWNAVKTFFTDTIPGAISTVAAYFKVFWDNYLIPIKDFILGMFSNAWNAVKTMFTETIPTAVSRVASFFKVLWDNYMEPLRAFVVGVFYGAWKTVTDFWNNTLMKGIESLWKKFSEFQTKYLEPFATMITNSVLKVFKDLYQYWERTLKPGIRGLWEKFEEFRDKHLKPVVDWVTGVLQPAFTGIKDALNSVLSFVQDVFTGQWESAWNAISSAFSTVWEGFKGIAKAPINSIIDFLNQLMTKVETCLNRIITGINDLFTFTIGPISMPGPIPDVPELPFQLVSLPTIDWFSKHQIPKLAKGGVLEDGQAIIAEAGPELLTMQGGKAVVQPLTNTANNYNAGGVTINVYAQPGQDIRELADLVMERMDDVYDQRGAVFA